MRYTILQQKLCFQISRKNIVDSILIFLAVNTVIAIGPPIKEIEVAIPAIDM